MATDPAFLTYYLEELNHLRVAGQRFAQTYPHFAGGLDFQGQNTDDPQIARLIESFAFLSAKLQQQFNAQFPEIPTALLEALYPQLVAPIPSMAIAQFHVSPKQYRAMEGITVPRQTAMFATSRTGEECRFSTGFPLTLWPVEVAAVKMQAASELPLLDAMPEVQACLRVTLSCVGQNRTFADVAAPSLRFFIDGERNSRFGLFDLLVNNLLQIAVLRPEAPQGPDASFATGLRLRPIGLAPEEAMLPYPEASHHGYRLLQEYFNFPDKFMFVELEGITPGMLGTGRTVDLLFLLDTDADRLIIDAKSMRLGCVPIINLFHRTSEPIRLDHMSVDYPLEPDIRALDTTEIHSVLSVSRSAASDLAADTIQPYFSPLPDAANDGSLRWVARRQPLANPAIGGTEMQLSFVDPAMNPMVPAADVLFARLLCTNRGLARQLPAMASFQIEADLPIESIRCLAKPTIPVDPPLAGENLWRLVSQLSLNKLSLGSINGNPDGLKQILILYGGTDENSRKHRQIDAIESIVTRPIVRRIADRNWRGFVRGTEIVVTIKEEGFVGSSALLFGYVLDRFFALYAGVNSFTELVLRRAHQEGDWKRWPARAGDRPIV